MRQEIRNKKELKHVRTKLRANMPAPELILWQVIRNKVLGVKFRRQFSVYGYILDFYSPTASLAIEVDGESHYDDESKQVKDKKRDEELRRLGIRVLRFTNHDILINLEGVVSKIVDFLPPLNLPLFYEQGEKHNANTPSPGERSKRE